MQKHASLTIRYLSNREIDKSKWDVCIFSSSLPIIYATHSYLDGMCGQWNALILDDYDAVMPLPHNKKWLIRYIYSPYFVIAGGVFGKEITQDVFLDFINAIPKRFRYADLDLNEHNFFENLLPHNNTNFLPRKNTYLDLNRTYETLFSNYHKGAKRKLKKASAFCFTVNKKAAVKEVIELYKQHYKAQDTVISRYDFTNMISLLSGKLAAQTRTYILSFPDGDIAAFYLLLFDEKYVYWLLGGSTAKGKEAGAFYHITDLVIRDFAGTKRTFRFEGSDQDGIHFFNGQFGGKTVYYPRLKMNRLPWPFRYLK